MTEQDTYWFSKKIIHCCMVPSNY